MKKLISLFFVAYFSSFGTFAEDIPTNNSSSTIIESPTIPQNIDEENLEDLTEASKGYKIKNGYYRQVPWDNNVFAFCSAPPPCPKPKSWCRKWRDVCPRGLLGK